MWRQTGGCSVDGPREPTRDKGCLESISRTDSGYCECLDGSKKMKKGCEPAQYLTCEEACSAGN